MKDSDKDSELEGIQVSEPTAPARDSGSKWTEVRSSGIHQRGLFARRTIPKGTRFIEYIGDRIIKSEAERRGIVQDEQGRAAGHGTVYIFNLNDRFDIDGGVVGNDAKYVNHSCDPNAESEIKGHRIWLYALRTINKGVEIVYDYNFDASHYRDHPCRCGAKNCVGYIVGSEYHEELKELLRKDRKKDKKKKKKGKKR